jgi:hypothetical protein
MASLSAEVAEIADAGTADTTKIITNVRAPA